MDVGKITKLEKRKLSLLLIMTFLASSISYAVTDSDLLNNQMDFNVTVVETNNLTLTLVYMDHVISEESSLDTRLDSMIQVINKTYPIADYGLRVRPGYSRIVSTDEKILPNRLINNLDFENSLTGQNERVIALVPTDWIKEEVPITDGLGFTYRGSYSSVVEPHNVRFIAAHEIGHTFMLCDEYEWGSWFIQNIFSECPNGDTNDDGLLDSACSDRDSCSTSTFGYLAPWINTPEFEEDLDNFMGAARSNFVWITNESYIHIMQELQENITTNEAVVISGSYNHSSDRIEIANIYVLDAGKLTTQDQTTEGNFTLELLDSGGAVLSNLSFKMQNTLAAYNSSTNTTTNMSFFTFVMNNSPDLNSIRITKLGVIKNETNKTPNTPAVSITSPSGGETFDQSFTITWNATDADNDTLNYAVLISSDNGDTFSTLEIDYPNTSLTINSTNFINSDEYLVKILATDGINTGNDTTETFSILHDQNKFYVKDNTGNNIAWFGDAGNVVIKGSLEQNSNFQRTDNFAFVIRNDGEDVLIIENNGSMYIDGTLFENQDTITSLDENTDFRIKDTDSNLVINVNETGYVFLKGTLTENGDP